MTSDISTLTGRVDKQTIHAGSKSEREAVVLIVDTKQYVLRQQGGNAVRDPEMEALIGKTVQGEGRVNGHVFVMFDWECID